MMYFCRRKDIFILNDLNAMKEVVRITEADLKKMVAKSIKEYINEGCLRLNYENPLPQSDIIVEMARINTDESNLFPQNSYEIQIWSNDHMPPHFHILKDGWDVAFLIENGNLYKINNSGKNKQIYNYMIKNVKKWLSSKCAVLPMATNQQNANAIWRQLHG